ncbi:MAG: methyltransferase domain-containing protein [Gammaproteobacteria bacterium]
MATKLKLDRLKLQPDHRMTFLKGFLRNPQGVASVLPSSRFMERRLIRAADISNARQVIELGPGTGGTTRAMLSALPSDATLLAIEINPRFVALLRSNPDPRLRVHLGSAEHIHAACELYGLDSPEVVISGIPFSTMPPATGKRIIRAAWSALAPGGRFIAYQFRDRVAVIGRRMLGAPEVDVELRNVPPMRIYTWRKPPADQAAAGG